MSAAQAEEESEKAMKRQLYKFIVVIATVSTMIPSTRVTLKLYDSKQPFQTPTGIRLIPMNEVFRELCLALYVTTQSDVKVKEYVQVKRDRLQGFDLFHFISLPRNEQEAYLGLGESRIDIPFVDEYSMFIMLTSAFAPRTRQFIETELPTLSGAALSRTYLNLLRHEIASVGGDFEDLKREAATTIELHRLRRMAPGSDLEVVALGLPPPSTPESALFIKVVKWLSYTRGKRIAGYGPGGIVSVLSLMDCSLLVKTHDDELKFMPVKKMVGQARVALALLCDRTHDFTATEVVNEISFDSEQRKLLFNIVKLLYFSREELEEYYTSIRRLLEQLPRPKREVIERILQTLDNHTLDRQLSSALEFDSSNLTTPIPYAQKLYSDLGGMLMVNARRILLGREARCCNAECENSTTQVCGGCHKVLFCSRSCQKASWRAGHKEECLATDPKTKIGAVESASTWTSELYDVVGAASQGSQGSQASQGGGAQGGSSGGSRGAQGGSSGGSRGAQGGAQGFRGGSSSNLDVLGGYPKTFYMPRI
jgi:uncharacterized membrane protein YgcG